MHPALGIDYGEARIGIAATDACGILAHPVESIHLQRTEPLERIATLVKDRGIRTLVLGLPLRMDGTEGTACAKVRAFGGKLHARLPELPPRAQINASAFRFTREVISSLSPPAMIAPMISTDVLP